MFKSLSNKEFIQNHWQKEWFFEKNTCVDLSDIISGDELAGLACDERIVSRLVQGHGHNELWSCAYGSFEPSAFTELAETNWSLLVESVDQVIPEIYQVLERFCFLPKWRVDDIMMSYAVPGGGVGPHFDYYDVFLIQISGTRKWRLGQNCDHCTALLPNDDMKLLKNFIDHAEVDAQAGDVLYIPAGMAHWGTATSTDCITMSVGFRAPSRLELLSTAMELYLQDETDDRRYTDSVESIDTNPYKINLAAHHNLAQMTDDFDQQHWQFCLQQAFGQLITETVEYDHSSSQLHIKSFNTQFDQSQLVKLELDMTSRFAYDSRTLFVNGKGHDIDEEFSQGIVAGEVSLPLSIKQLALLVELVNQGVVNLLK